MPLAHTGQPLTTRLVFQTRSHRLQHPYFLDTASRAPTTSLSSWIVAICASSINLVTETGIRDRLVETSSSATAHSEFVAVYPPGFLHNRDINNNFRKSFKMVSACVISVISGVWDVERLSIWLTNLVDTILVLQPFSLSTSFNFSLKQTKKLSEHAPEKC